MTPLWRKLPLYSRYSARSRWRKAPSFVGVLLFRASTLHVNKARMCEAEVIKIGVTFRILRYFGFQSEQNISKCYE